MAGTIDPAVLKELQDWATWKNAQNPQALLAASRTDPTLMAKYSGDLLSPAAKAYVVGRQDPTTGTPAVGVGNQHFDEKTGQIADNGGFWSLPESYAILGAAGGLGGVAAAPLLAGAGGAAGGGGSAGTVAGTVAGGSTALPSSLSGWLGLASQIAPVVSGIAGGRAQGAVATANANQGQDRNAIALYNTLVNANQGQNAFALQRGNLANSNAATDLAQRQFALQAPNVRGGTAVRGDILANAKDATVSGVSPNVPVPTISGGLRPSMFSDSTRQLGSLMSQGALAGQQKGDTFAAAQPLPDYTAPPAPPSLTGLPNTGLTQALGTTGSLLTLAPTFANLLKKYGQQPGQGTTDTGDYSSAGNY